MQSWIRTSLTLIGIGFGVDAITEDPNMALYARILGLSFIIVALFSVIVSMTQYRHELIKLEGGSYRYQSGLRLGFVVAAALGLVGLFAGITIVIGALAG